MDGGYVIAEQLVKNGYLADIKPEEAKFHGVPVVVINEITCVSKPGRRVYVKSAEIPKVKSGRGMVLVSTSKGVMSGQEAVKQKLGGELLLKVY